MRAELISRNYAETLLALAERNGGDAAVEQFGVAMQNVAGLLQNDPRVRQFMETPRVTLEQRKAALTAALRGRVPELVLRFIMVVVEKRRGPLLAEIGEQYQALVDERMGRVRVSVTLSHAPDAALMDEIRAGLEARMGRAVIPTFSVDPEILGGIVLRRGDDVLDGSVRTRATRLRRAMMAADLPPLAAPAAV
ncbi:MAG TPA: ATP synthase F1 subunit delta [Longimicrobium sp.]|uniref:ATP synthase F1 subunit delta n=1 Tax=Longimicrobium sp. TaxID=2029185 RepID=UPI002EDA8091